jgi:hypothetical protein
MKKRLVLAVLAAASITPYLSSVTYKTSQTFMFTRPLFLTLFPQQHLWNTLINDTPAGRQASLQAIYMQQESRPLARNSGYFLLDCQPIISVKGEAAINPNQPADNQRNVRAEWLGLDANFSSDYSLCPQQTENGFFFEYNRNLGKLLPVSFLKGWWLDIFVPYVHVKNRLNPRGQEELVTALNNPDWLGGRISPKTLTASGVPEIRLNLGTTLLDSDGFICATYSGIAVPTLKKYPSGYLFEPLLGVNGHIAFISGLTLELPVYQKEGICQMHLIFNAKNDWYLAHSQTRTFDLWNKPWARYMQYRREGEEKTISGVQLLTRKVEVHPNNMYELCASFRANLHNFYLEAGYSLWGHGNERLELPTDCCQGLYNDNFDHYPSGYWLEKYAIAGPTEYVNGQPVYTSASASTISTLIPDPVGDFVTLKGRDIFSCSGNGRGDVVNKGQACVGYAFSNEHITAFFALGGYFEAPVSNALLKNAGWWLKGGIDF